MKIKIDTKQFLNAMGRIAPCIKNNPSTPILACALFETKEGLLTITGTDYEKTAQTSLKVESDADGIFCVDHKMFTAIVKNAIAPNIEVEVNDKNAIINLSHSTYELPLDDVKAFPTVDFESGAKDLGIEKDIFFEAIIEAKKFTNNDDLRMFFNVHIFGKNDCIKVVASDNHSVYENILGETDEEFSLLLPNRCVGYFETVEFDSATASIGYTEKSLIVRDDLTTVSMLLTDGQFPDTDRVMPNYEFTTKFSCDREALMAALNRLSVVYAGLKEKGVRFDVSNDITLVSANDKAFNTQGKEYVEGTLEGNGMPIGFNAHFLLKALNCIDLDEVVLNMTESNRALIVKDGDGKRIMVLPLMLHKD